MLSMQIYDGQNSPFSPLGSQVWLINSLGFKMGHWSFIRSLHMSI